MADQSEYIGNPEAAQIAGLSRKTLNAYALGHRRPEIPVRTRRDGHRWVYHRDDLEALAAHRSARGNHQAQSAPDDAPEPEQAVSEAAPSTPQPTVAVPEQAASEAPPSAPQPTDVASEPQTVDQMAELVALIRDQQAQLLSAERHIGELEAQLAVRLSLKEERALRAKLAAAETKAKKKKRGKGKKNSAKASSDPGLTSEEERS